MSQRIFVAAPRRAKRTMSKWVKRSVIAGIIFTAGLTMGHASTVSEQHKACSGYHYSHGDYRADVQDYGQKVADYNDGYATAMTDVCKSK